MFYRWGIPIQTQVEVIRRTRAIDVVIWCEEEHLHLLQGTAFEFARRVNSLELKSPGDPMDLADYMLITSRAYGLLAKQEKEENQLPHNATLTILSSVRPTKLLDDLREELGFLPTPEPGIYLSSQQIETRIIVATELQVIEKNYPLLILAKGEKLLEFFEEVVRKGLTEYIEILFQVGVEIDPDTLAEGVRDMAQRRSKYQRNLERILEALFEVSPESMERMTPFRQVLEEERKNAGLRVRETAVEAAVQAKQEDLSLLLESKFGQLPEAVVSKLKALHDVEELKQLYRLALNAQTLEEVGL